MLNEVWESEKKERPDRAPAGCVFCFSVGPSRWPNKGGDMLE